MPTTGVPTRSNSMPSPAPQWLRWTLNCFHFGPATQNFASYKSSHLRHTPHHCRQHQMPLCVVQPSACDSQAEEVMSSMINSGRRQKAAFCLRQKGEARRSYELSDKLITTDTPTAHVEATPAHALLIDARRSFSSQRHYHGARTKQQQAYTAECHSAA